MANRVYMPTRGPQDWQRLLAEPKRHWRPGHSAHALAHVFEHSYGLPDPLEKALQATGEKALAYLDLILGLPEYQTPLPGGSRPSQTDLLLLVRNDSGLVVIAIEAKVEESLGPRVSEWLFDASPGKESRLEYLCDLLGLTSGGLGHLRYQLLHRTAAALMEAERFHAQTAVMIVYSFSANRTGFEDFAAFARVMGVEASPGQISQVGERHGRTLAIGWVTDTLGRVVVCPNCRKSDRIVTILYGMPIPELIDAAERGEVALGGCCIAPDNPTHRCRRCSLDIAQPRG